MEDTVEISKTGPKWKTNRVIVKPSRDKEIRITTDQRGITSSFVEKVAKAPLTLFDLEQEFHILTLLSGSGFTPYPQMLKKDEQNPGTGRLMIEHVPGMSLEDRLNSNQHLPIATFPNVITSALDGIDAVHLRGIIIGDLNKGTFMIDDKRDSVKLVDFEFAHEQDDLSNPELYQIFRNRLISDDLGMRIAYMDTDFHFDATFAKLSEKHKVAKTFLDYYFSYSEKGPNSQFVEFDLDRLTGDDKILLEERRKTFTTLIEIIVRDNFAYLSSREREQMKHIFFSEAIMDLTLPYVLQDNGIQLDPDLLTRIKKTLSPTLSERL